MELKGANDVRKCLSWAIFYLGCCLAVILVTTTPVSGLASHSPSATAPTTPVRPPWTFRASRIYYQFQAIHVDTAQKYGPPCCRADASPLAMVSIGGYTLGGIFCVEYEDSPIGPYREVAVLSSLMIRLPSIHTNNNNGLFSLLPAIGAWASHIFVTAESAAQYGQEFWGLPATVTPIEFLSEDDHDGSMAVSSLDKGERSSHPALLFSDQTIQFHGWEKTSTLKNDKNRQHEGNNNKIKSTILDRINISLPSFSGLLPGSKKFSIDDTNSGIDGKSPLLQYPLSIVEPSSIALEPTFESIEFHLSKSETTRSSEEQSSQNNIHQVQELFSESYPLISVGVSNVNLVAGVPTVIESRGTR